MSKIVFSKQEKEVIAARIKLYFRDKLDQEIGQFDAEFLLDFFAEEIGPYFYNHALEDAKEIFLNQMSLVDDALFDIQKPTKFVR